MNKFRGYISSRKLNNGSFVDQSIQNLVIRKACENNDLLFMLSATEYGMKNCFLMLNQVLLEINKGKFDGIAFFSLDQLPKKNEMKKKIFDVVLKKRKKILISQENILIKDKTGISKVEELLKIKNLLSYCPKSLA